MFIPIIFLAIYLKKVHKSKNMVSLPPSQFDINNMALFTKIADFIGKHEGKVNYLYDDATGKRITAGSKVEGRPTIGIGHLVTIPEKYLYMGIEITDKKIYELFRNDVSMAFNQVKQAVKIPITEGQFIALVSFVYNVGIGTAQKTIERLNSGKEHAEITGQWLLYNKARINGELVEMAGLTKRRIEEVKIYKS